MFLATSSDIPIENSLLPPPLAPPPQEEGNDIIYRKIEPPSSCGGRVGDGGNKKLSAK